jgi:hypothetical protein
VAWHKGQTAKIKVPAGNYATVDKAILLAGRFDGRALTLLAAGELTRVNGVDGTNIDDSTTSVTFTLTALECAIQKSADSGFQITTPGNSAGTTTINGRTIPYFNIPKNNATVQAKLTVDGVPAAGANYPLKLNESSSAAKITSIGYYTERDPPAEVVLQSGTGVTVNGGTFTINSGAVTDNIAGGGGSGGGVCLKGGGTFNMIGGSITGNETNTRGGGVLIFNTGVLT